MKIYKIRAVVTYYDDQGNFHAEPENLAYQSINERVTYVMGRDPEMANVVLNHTSVSKKHGSIMIDGTKMLVRDEGSSNGVYVDGQAVRSLKVDINDRMPDIYLGMVWIRIEQEEMSVGPKDSLQDKFKRKTSPKKLHFSDFADEGKPREKEHTAVLSILDGILGKYKKK